MCIISGDSNFINQIIKSYNDTKLKIYNNLGGTELSSYETAFIDDKTIALEVEKIKREIQSIENLITTSTNTTKQEELSKKRIQLYIEITFLMSNNLDNVDKCIELLTGVKTNFLTALNALKQYQIGNHSQALNSFYQYIEELESYSEHFLINRVLGTLLFDNKQYKNAIPFLRKAVEKRPEQLEIHKMLLLCYKNENMTFEYTIQVQLVNMLG